MNAELLDLLEKLDAAATPAPWQPKCGFTNGKDADWTKDDSFVGWETMPDISAERRAFAKGADCHLVCLLRTHASELIAAARRNLPPD